MSTTRREKIRRRRYIRRFAEELFIHEEAIHTYAERMIKLGLFSKKTAKSDVKGHIMQTAAKILGHRTFYSLLNRKRWW